MKDDTLHMCNAEWPYQEVRRLAVLTAEEMQYFEESIARLSAVEYCDFKSVSNPVSSSKKVTDWFVIVSSAVWHVKQEEKNNLFPLLLISFCAD